MPIPPVVTVGIDRLMAATMVSAVVPVTTLVATIVLLLSVAFLVLEAAIMVISVTTSDIILAAVMLAVIGDSRAKDGKSSHASDNGGGFAAILCTHRGRAKPGHGERRAEDDCDKLAVHDLIPFRFHNSEVKALVELTVRDVPKVGLACLDRQ